MKVLIPSPLHSYTGGSQVEATGSNLAAVLRDLDRQYPGIRFRMVDEQERIRRNLRIFIGGEQEFDLARPLAANDEVIIVQALTGG